MLAFVTTSKDYGSQLARFGLLAFYGVVIAGVTALYGLLQLSQYPAFPSPMLPVRYYGRADLPGARYRDRMPF